ncbi:MAG: metal-dependent hydrolase [Candidatus Lokiarchaeota archaeon]|nr:metal-dependent hydrolase [Candidatus Lokiarchaeota archaeon]
MDVITHFVFGILMYIFFLKEVTFEYIFLAIFLSILPDLDIFLTPLKRKFKSNYLEHRGGSHSYIIGIIISFIVGLIYSSLTQQSFYMVWIISLIFYSLHVSMDLLTTTKIPCFYPLSKKEYSFYVEKAGSLFTMVNSIIFLIFLGILIFNSVEIFLLNLFVNIYTFFFIIYYLYRIISKILLSSNFKRNQKFLPGILPFYYTIYNYNIIENEISLSIDRKSHFSKTKDTETIKTILSKEEMNLFKKVTELCNNHYYYAKWTLVPIFIRNEEIFTIKIFFLETMIRKKTMYIQYDFGIRSQQLIGFNRGSGQICQ